MTERVPIAGHLLKKQFLHMLKNKLLDIRETIDMYPKQK